MMITARGYAYQDWMRFGPGAPYLAAVHLGYEDEMAKTPEGRMVYSRLVIELRFHWAWPWLQIRLWSDTREIIEKGLCDG